MKQKRKEIISLLQKKGVKEKMPWSAVGLFTDMIIHSFGGSASFNHSRFNGWMQKVTMAQEKIGLDLLLCGLHGTEWHEYFLFLKVFHPEQRVNTLLLVPWENGAIVIAEPEGCCTKRAGKNEARVMCMVACTEVRIGPSERTQLCSREMDGVLPHNLPIAMVFGFCSFISLLGGGISMSSFS